MKQKIALMILILTLIIPISSYATPVEVNTLYNAEQNIGVNVQSTEESTEKPLNTSSDPLYKVINGEIVGASNLYYSGKIVSQTVRLKDIQNNIILLSISEEAYKQNNIVFKDKNKLVGLYLNESTGNFPPRYETLVVALAEEPNKSVLNFKYDRFRKIEDGKFISRDNLLEVSTHDRTRIIDLEGNIYNDSIDDKQLLIMYSVSTKSTPSKTYALKIIVIPENNQDTVVTENNAENKNNAENVDTNVKLKEVENLSIIKLK